MLRDKLKTIHHYLLTVTQFLTVAELLTRVHVEGINLQHNKYSVIQKHGEKAVLRYLTSM